MRRFVLAITLAPCCLVLIAVAGCKQSAMSPQNGGFTISTVQRYQSANGQFGPPQPVPSVPITGEYENYYDNIIPQGSVYDYGDCYNSIAGECAGDPLTANPLNDPALVSGTYFVQYGVATALWNNKFSFPFYCGDTDLLGTFDGYSTGGPLSGGSLPGPVTFYGYLYANDPTYLQTGAEDTCYYFYNGQPGVPPASTRFAIVGQEPQTITLTGQTALETAYGMPQLVITDKDNNFVKAVTATSVSSDQTQATFPFPSSLPSGAYGLALVNSINTGRYAPGGTNLLSVAITQTIAGNHYGVAVSGQTHTTQTCKWYPGPTLICGVETSTYTTTPVVSLYSQNQVLVGSTAVTVGANPTAVVTYNGGVVNEGWSPNTNSYSGDTRAVVADSGTNLVSILDVVRKNLLENVIVGNHPVALVVSADSTKAFVANYGDSTVSEVNLTSGTVLNTVAVGGQPTSVALTSGGTLWVGGNGFLTEINTSDMSTVATESTSGQTITSLAYSDQVNELVATSTRNTGNLSLDELNPSAVTSGGIYTPLASHTLVGSLQTYYNPRLQAQVQGYDATVATSTVPINSNLPGAPPLVVQDGWALVTATPTGFTITDISGHLVLISETTPSPVAAVAVDHALNVVYLTMPDSNTLLSVPLPGVN